MVIILEEPLQYIKTSLCFLFEQCNNTSESFKKCFEASHSGDGEYNFSYQQVRGTTRCVNQIRGDRIVKFALIYFSPLSRAAIYPNQRHLVPFVTIWYNLLPVVTIGYHSFPLVSICYHSVPLYTNQYHFG